jgi:hypothetical protein
MSDTHKQQQLQLKAQALAKVLEKHNPQQTSELAFKLMENSTPGTDEFKAYAALYEVMEILK